MSGRAGKWFGTPAIAILTLALVPVFPAPSLCSGQALPAQSTRVAGRVLTADSSAVPGIQVTLHRIGGETQGPTDSTRSDRRGRFHLVFRPDTAAFYLLSARYAGIEYFSTPVPTNPQLPDTVVRLVVYDTSSTAAVALAARHFVLTRPAEDGSRSVLDLIVLRNDGGLTRVAPDTLRPSWSAPLPPGTIGFEVGESDISVDAVTRRVDSLIVTAPLAPGEKQLTIQYQVPRGRSMVELPVDSGLAINILVEEKDVAVRGPGLQLADSQVIQGRSFRRWTGVAPAAGTARLALPDIRDTPRWLLAALVAGLGLTLGAVGWYHIARRRRVPAAPPDELLDAIARLDARYQGREGETEVEEWRSYQIERARLKAALETSLAAGGWSR
jgi:hypothetical protein